jgi:ribosomal protein L16 Arg81 hydroxylase
VHPWPLVETLPADQQYEREIMPVLRCRLQAGDWLYIPGGYWHSTKAADDSISLSVGLRALTAIDVYDFLRPRLLEAIEWRQRLPAPVAASALSDEELLASYRECFRELGESLAQMLGNAELVQRFVEERRHHCGG